MLLSLSEAKEYTIEKIKQFTGEDVSEEEADIIEMSLEQDFFDKAKTVVSDAEISAEHLETPEKMEGYLFHRIPNYTTMLEETVIDFLSDYLAEEDESDPEDEDEPEDENTDEEISSE